MLVALAVVGDRLALERVLGGREVDRPALGARRLDRALERPERGAGVAAGAVREELERLVVDLGRIGDPALGLRQGAAQERLDVVRAQLAELVDLTAREERRVHLEVRVLGRRADQGHEPLLDRRQERVLLGLVEAVDLVEEEDGAPAGACAARAPARSPR